MNKFTNLFAIVLAPVSLSACGMSTGTEADRIERKETAAATASAAREAGFPNIVNFYEKRLLREIYERRDQADLSTFAYFQGMDGRLICLGKAMGYGVPYSTQFSNPSTAYWGGAEVAQTYPMPQPEPNGLFTPEGMSATWLQLVTPSGDIKVVYLEPTVVVSPFELTGPAVATGC